MRVDGAAEAIEGAEGFLAHGEKARGFQIFPSRLEQGGARKRLGERILFAIEVVVWFWSGERDRCEPCPSLQERPSLEPRGRGNLLEILRDRVVFCVFIILFSVGGSRVGAGTWLLRCTCISLMSNLRQHESDQFSCPRHCRGEMQMQLYLALEPIRNQGIKNSMLATKWGHYFVGDARIRSPFC
jgi:hypothetical protein